jgi:hypothetical protein
MDYWPENWKMNPALVCQVQVAILYWTKAIPVKLNNIIIITPSGHHYKQILLF